jgi:hypothetical protein
MGLLLLLVHPIPDILLHCGCSFEYRIAASQPAAWNWSSFP